MTFERWLLLFIFTAAWEAFWKRDPRVDQKTIKAIGRYLDPNNPFMR